MRISDFAVRNVPFMLVASLLLGALGISAWLKISRTEDPHFPISAFSVVVVYPGADPQEIEHQVVQPIEDAIHTLDDVKELISTADDSLGIVRVEFEAYVDTEKRYDELTREIDAVARKLPSGVASIEINKINPGDVNIVQYALVSDTASYRTLEDTAKDLKDALERIPGVKKSETWAYPQRELRVELDLKRLAELHLSPIQVLGVIQADNINVPGGAVEAGARRFNIKTSGAYRSVQQVLDTVIAGNGAQAIHVADVATVRWDSGPLDYVARFDGERAVYVTANQKTGHNIFETKAQIDSAVADFAKTLPAGISLQLGFDQSRNVKSRLDRLGHDFTLAIILVALTLLPLGLRAAGIVMVSLPLSLLTGLAALYFAGFSLNQLSIAGFVIALGLLVDDSIVVTENIARFLRMGHTPDEAAMRATRQISLAVLGCTATLLFAFVPLLALPGNAGKFIRSMPLAVVFTVSASLLVSLSIIPFLASRVLPRDATEDGNAALRLLMRLIHGVYAPWLRRALAHPRLTVGLSALAFGLSFALVPQMGLSLFPHADTPQFLIDITTPNGSSLTRTGEVLDEVEQVLDRQPEIKHLLSNLGHGNPRIYYNEFPHEDASNYAEIFVQLKAFDPRLTPALLDRLRQRFDAIPGAEIVVKEFENGPPIEAPIALRVIGPDLDTLRDMAARIETLMRATPGVRNISNPLRRSRVDLQLDIDTAKAGLLGVPVLDLDRTVRLAVAGLSAGDFHEPDGDKYPIMLRAAMQTRPTLSTLEGLHVASAGGAQVPLAELATLKLSESPPRIYRRNRERAVSISAYTETGYNTEAVTNNLLGKLAKMDWPPAYRYEAGGEVDARKDSFAGFGTAIIVAVFGIMAILVLEFGSFRSTLIVAGVIPLGVTGGIVLLYLCGYSLSFTAMVGFIALIGIEIKNSILLVDFTNQLRLQGKPLDEAIAEAGEIRFLPILLTSVTAIGGLLPLALQNSPLYSPMALVIIGGLISSTLIGRLVTPVMYKLLPPDLSAASAEAPGY
ncbi:efflux RND transporter permease subunit [Solimonas terrae]|uniref:Efflux RND transporter permease subunit n=1 Tax=Solimonas terrae TaxID=1396819 RepID=A0A6M2BRD7_9GAMM|nr:efflux RND transporter permease subunit [Solimonas terrae]NGY05156.1 efflux RND transporter permease subunit [Solimonas terrae]